VLPLSAVLADAGRETSAGWLAQWRLAPRMRRSMDGINASESLAVRAPN
jgi:hypothetical protein